MIPIYSRAEIRAAEAYHLAHTPPGALMRAAAWAVANAALQQVRPPVPGRAAALLVGSGDNGGDALYAGRRLRSRGMAVTAILTDPARAHRGGLAALIRAGGQVLAAGDERAESAVAAADVVIDGLVGLGARPPLRAETARLVEAANSADGRRIAVDLPSGIDPDSGRADGTVFDADVTVTFGGVKTALALGAAGGDVRVAEIGMTPDGAGIKATAWALTDDDVAAAYPRPGRADNKFSLGVTGIVAGSARYPGAALLAVGGAVAARPGLVRYAGPQVGPVVGRWPEVVGAASVTEAGRVQAWVVGPGLGLDAAASRSLAAVLDDDAPVVVDADALTLTARDPLLLAARARRGAVTVLTPHRGEFLRLFPDLDPQADDGPSDRLAAARAAAARTGAVVLLKGDRTVIAAPDGRAYVTLAGSPYLATAGSGDVLAGLAGALISAGIDAPLAAAIAAHVHGRAGERAAAVGRPGASALVALLRSTCRAPGECGSIGG